MGDTVTVRGRFDGESVELLETPPAAEPCDVTVTFERSDEERRETAERTRGAWLDDPRPTDEIIEEMMASRLLARRLLDDPCIVGPQLSEEERQACFERACGSWKDSRTTDEIIEDIVGSRTYGREVPEL